MVACLMLPKACVRPTRIVAVVEGSVSWVFDSCGPGAAMIQDRVQTISLGLEKGTHKSQLALVNIPVDSRRS